MGLSLSHCKLNFFFNFFLSLISEEVHSGSKLCVLSLSSSLLKVLEIRGRKASQLNTWESIQKENLLSIQNKKQRESDSERLKRTSCKSVTHSSTIVF